MIHTNGPWQLVGPFLKPYPLSGEEREIILNGPTKPDGWATYLGSIVWNDKDLDKAAEFQANARLIAAAPEMLDEIIELRKQMQWVIDNCEVDVVGRDALINSMTGSLSVLKKVRGEK